MFPGWTISSNNSFQGCPIPEGNVGSAIEMCNLMNILSRKWLDTIIGLMVALSYLSGGFVLNFSDKGPMTYSGMGKAVDLKK